MFVHLQMRAQIRNFRKREEERERAVKPRAPVIHFARFITVWPRNSFKMSRYPERERERQNREPSVRLDTRARTTRSRNYPRAVVVLCVYVCKGVYDRNFPTARIRCVFNKHSHARRKLLHAWWK